MEKTTADQRNRCRPVEPKKRNDTVAQPFTPRQLQLIPHHTKIGPYEVLGILNNTGFGQVAHAYDPSTERDVAIKIYPLDQHNNEYEVIRHLFRKLGPKERRYFFKGLKEITFDGHRCLVTPFYRRSLRDYFKERSDVTSNDDLQFFAKTIAHSLRALHRVGVVHGDLTPDHVMIDDSAGYMKGIIVSFGRAVVMPKRDAFLPGYRLSGKDDYYIPMEAMLNAGTYGPPADVYSLGMLLLEMKMGHQLDTTTEADDFRAIDDHFRWQLSNREFTSFVKRCICFDDQKRLTSDQACENKWLLTHRSGAEKCFRLLAAAIVPSFIYDRTSPTPASSRSGAPMNTRPRFRTVTPPPTVSSNDPLEGLEHGDQRRAHNLQSIV